MYAYIQQSTIARSSLTFASTVHLVFLFKTLKLKPQVQLYIFYYSVVQLLIIIHTFNTHCFWLKYNRQYVED